MKKSIVIPIFLACLANAESAVVEKVDRFTGKTEISSLVRYSPAKQPSLLLTALGENGRFAFAIGFLSKSEEWEYLNCSNTHWLIDGKPFTIEQPAHDGTVGTGYVLEYLWINGVTKAQIDKLAKAQKIEVKICNDEFTLTEYEMTDLREFAKKVSEGH